MRRSNRQLLADLHSGAKLLAKTGNSSLPAVRLADSALAELLDGLRRGRLRRGMDVWIDDARGCARIFLKVRKSCAFRNNPWHGETLRQYYRAMADLS